MKNIIIIFLSLLISIIVFNIYIFLPLDWDTSYELIKMYYNEIWNNYNHHQFVVPYLKFFFNIFSFIDNDYKRFAIIFFFHYFLSLIVLWEIIKLFSKNFLFNLIYFISFSISGILLFLVLTFEDSVLTLPYYLLSFYFFILFYEKKQTRLIIISAIVSGFSVSVNSSDFFFVVSVLGFFLVMILNDIIFEKKINKFYIYIFIIYFIIFSFTLLLLLLIKSHLGRENLFFLISETFVSPYKRYSFLIGESGITLPRFIKTFNALSFILIQDTRFLTQFNINIVLYNFIILSVQVYAIWLLRHYKPIIAIVFVLFINIFLLVTSDENAINERLISSIFIFIIMIKSPKKWIPIFFSLLFFYSTFNLKNHHLQNETNDLIFKISKYRVVYVPIYHFYNEKFIQKLNKKEIQNDRLINSSSMPIIALSQLIFNNECYIYNPYDITFPYLPKNCKVINKINENITNKDLSDIYIDPYLLDIIHNKTWTCDDLKNYLKQCNHTLKSYITKKSDFFDEHFINQSCNSISIDCVQKVQFSCNYIYYCQKSFLEK